METVFKTGWVPESKTGALARWNDLRSLGEYNENDQRETTTQPIVIDWNQFQPRVKQQMEFRSAMRSQGYCYWPWRIAEYYKIPWIDFNQGPIGSCAGCATNNAVNAALLMHLADGYPFEYHAYNPYPMWSLGKHDEGYNGEGATLSMMLSSANKHGMFRNEIAGKYDDWLGSRKSITDELLKDAERFQLAACYLGDMQGEELARAVFDCLAAGYPIVFGNSVAVDQSVTYKGTIKCAVNYGGWMHATARVAYRKEQDATEYIAHQGSWGEYFERGPEGEPASIVWETFSTFKQQCSGRYADAFAICMVEGETTVNADGMKLTPDKITYPA